MLSTAENENGISFPMNLRSDAVIEIRSLVSELCRQFYTLGWVSGTGGSITVKVHEESVPKSHQIIVMSPSGTNLSSKSIFFSCWISICCWLVSVVIFIFCLFVFRGTEGEDGAKGYVPIVCGWEDSFGTRTEGVPA